MLNVTRRVAESILAGDVEIHVKKITPTRVILGVVAPKGTRILRGELAAKDGDSPASKLESTDGVV